MALSGGLTTTSNFSCTFCIEWINCFCRSLSVPMWVQPKWNPCTNVIGRMASCVNPYLPCTNWKKEPRSHSDTSELTTRGHSTLHLIRYVLTYHNWPQGGTQPYILQGIYWLIRTNHRRALNPISYKVCTDLSELRTRGHSTVQVCADLSQLTTRGHSTLYLTRYILTYQN